jgi:hypothetical protein
METAMTEATILDLCCYKNNWIDYTNCKQTLLDLVENNFVYKTKPMSDGSEMLFDLTTDGRLCLKHFYARIPSSIRQIISDDIKKKRIEYRRRQDYVAKYTKCEDSSYDVELRIDEATKTTLSLTINVMGRDTAKYLERTWQDKAPQVYKKLEELLFDV